MVNYFIYAKDFSGSTNRVPYYHENGLKTLEEFKRDVNCIKSELPVTEESKIIYLHWGHMCEEIDESTAVSTYSEMIGDGTDTLPGTIIKWIKENIAGDKIKLLYIITDGLIRQSSVHTCLKLNENVYYESVVFYGINENLDSIDLSVASSFLKGRCKIYRNCELLDNIDISEQRDYSTITIDNFSTEKEELKSYIKLKYLNSKERSETALREIEELKKLRKRLFNDLSAIKITSNLDTKDKTTFLSEFKKTNWYKILTSGVDYDIRIDIDKSITTLINYIMSDKKSYSFDALKFKINYSNVVPEEEIVDVDFETDQEIEFPDIILDDEKGIPVILITELNLLDKIIFHANTEAAPAPASFSKFKSTMECPLFLLNDTDLNETIGYFYTLNVYKQLLEKTSREEPRTRRPYHGGLVLVNTGDFDKYNDYILSATYFNSKKVKYNIGLFYYVLWKICEKKQWMDKNVLEQFKKYMLRRVSTTVCRIGLSSLPLDPTENTSLPTALWYCVELSTIIFQSDPANFSHERLRMYHGVAHRMIEILKYLEYDLYLESIKKRVDLIRHVMTLKKITKQKDKVCYFLEKIFKKKDGFLVCEIQNSENLKKLNYLKLNHKEMLVDNIEERVILNDYIYTLHDIDDSELQICETTFRPYFMIDQNTSYYTEMYRKAKDVVICYDKNDIVVKYKPLDKLEFDRVLSYYNLFLRCVRDRKKYPTLEEYKAYVLKRKAFKDDAVTIFPTTVIESIEKVFRSYEKLLKDVSVSDFFEVCDKYIDRIARIKAENVRQFETDDEINDFIQAEERKANLVKIVRTSKPNKRRKPMVPPVPKPMIPKLYSRHPRWPYFQRRRRPM
ncbi:uncharacterized protein LOC114363287 isoform X3 [Ostrinia furnacalis]|uniref:uncharacterized protein LOC114363287 isoform X2 n=1 Tax=Ostrinia furnacalis TaxID=93504 RepID=UPI00103DD1F4|nr:uncharacterized protein LOC114363287 isoform X2 [Ostrinia furnacalis]XP_028174769.1 uncharacterized protein LOC114363287 isoform X3 [Ostrinia furnacalis]